MTMFSERERSFEKRFAQEEELKFKATARRNHLAGLWAAKRLGLADVEAEDYAQSLVTIDLDKPGSDAAFAKIDSDFRLRGVSVPADQIRRMMSDLMKQATTELNSPAR